ncbi:MAG: DUF6057 family protein [Phocaeicola sp.]|uniref:DUF6057 family protein n=1 Tax=Phocaeicola sp. TaxID=2773926 RepID=UPI00300EE032
MQNNIRALLSILFVGIAFLFWAIYYPFHLLYQEQYLLFLYIPSYFFDKLSYPGGVGEYIAEFLTQFYYYPYLGALIVALLLGGIQRLMYRIMLKMQKNSIDWYVLSFIPSLGTWAFLCDENSLLAGIVSLLLSMGISYGYMSLSRQWVKYVYVLGVFPLLYWCVGGVCIVTLCLILAYEWLVDSISIKHKSAISLLMVIAWGISVGYAILHLQYPVSRLITGIGYYRFPTLIPFSGVLTCVIVVLLAGGVAFLPQYQKYRSLYWSVQSVVVLTLGAGWIYSATSMKKERDMAYDYWASTCQWQQIIQSAEQNNPDTPLSVVCLNLALGKTGQLGERMFQFFQNGTDGLIPDFVRDYTIPLTVNEVYFHLGMINTSQRYVFEAMEANPSYHKSTRCIRRLAETNLLNGEYKVAAKYLNLLKHTLFYKKWAEETETYLYEEDKINSHPEWGRLRKMRYTEDFLFSENEKDMMLGLLLVHNKNNRLAFEYLLAYTLLNRDIASFLKYYPIGKNMGYAVIPRSYQEALVYVWTQSHPNFQGMPWSISPVVMKEVTEFATHYVRAPKDEAFFLNRFGKSYWYYLLFRK